MMWHVHGARGEVHEERFLRSGGIVLLDPAGGVIHQVGGQMIPSRRVAGASTAVVLRNSAGSHWLL
jgi:hypothetical protein